MTATRARSRRAVVLAAGAALRRARPRCTDWPAESPPRPLPARDGAAFRRTRLRTLPNGLQVIVVLHHEQPVVSMRLHRARRRRARSAGQGGPRHPRRVAARPGHDRRGRASEIADAIDFIGGAMGTGAGSDLTFVNVLVMKDSFDARPEHAVRHRAPPGVRARRDRAPAPADAVGACRSASRIPSSSPTRCSIGWSTASIRTGCPTAGTPEIDRRASRATISSTFHRRYFVPNNTHPRHRRRRDGATRRSTARRRSSATGSAQDVPPPTLPGAARPDAPRRHRRQARTRCRPRCASGSSACRASTPDYMA